MSQKIDLEEVYGPASTKSKDSRLSAPNNDGDSEDDSYCPVLPPHLLNKSAKPRIWGPTLPPGLGQTDTADILHEDDISESDEEVYGPMPTSTEIDSDFHIKELERRALQMKQKLLNKDDKPFVRESWMLELPEEKSKLAIFGMGTRSFSTKAPKEKGDQSVWTDTPADKERKLQQMIIKDDEKLKNSCTDIDPSPHDERLANYVEHFNEKKRSIPLVDMHQKKMKKEKPDEAGRRPFNREDDLKVNKFDEAQKATIMKKARQLDDRFSKGSKQFL